MMRLLALFISFLLMTSATHAQVPQFGDLLPTNDAPTTGRIIQYVLLLTVLAVAPSILVMVTSFTRFIVAFSFLRSALGHGASRHGLQVSACHGRAR